MQHNNCDHASIDDDPRGPGAARRRGAARRHTAVTVAVLAAALVATGWSGAHTAARPEGPAPGGSGAVTPVVLEGEPAEAGQVPLLVVVADGEDAPSVAAVSADAGAQVTSAPDDVTVAVTVDAGDVDEITAALEAHPAVAAVVVDEPQPPAQHTWDPAPHPAHQAIGAPAGWPDGGAGHTIGVLDTGVSRTHPATIGKVIAGACFSSGAAEGFEPACAGAGTGAGDPCTFAGCDHGTAIAGIAAGHLTGAGASTRGGVAPGAQLASVQVFSRDTRGGCAAAGCPAAFGSDIIAGLDWLADHAAELNLAAVNISIGAGDGTPSCDAGVGAAAVRRLTTAGIVVVAATGNSSEHPDGDPERISWPACLPEVIAATGAHPEVTATGDDWSHPTVQAFNGGDGVDIAAPGDGVPAPGPRGGWHTIGGTSVAAPAVAATATLRRAAGGVGAHVDGVVDDITSGDVPDIRTGRRYLWLWVPAATKAPTPATTTTVAPTTTTPPTTTTTTSAPSAPNRPALGNLEIVLAVGRDVTVTGWAFDPDGNKARVRVTNNGAVVATLTPNLRRDTVWWFFGGGIDRHSGYSHTHRSPTGDRRICTQLSDDGITWYSAQCRQVTVK